MQFDMLCSSKRCLQGLPMKHLVSSIFVFCDGPWICPHCFIFQGVNIYVANKKVAVLITRQYSPLSSQIKWSCPFWGRHRGLTFFWGGGGLNPSLSTVLLNNTN